MTLNEIKSFDEIKISTKTIIGRTNWKINIEDLFNILPITEYKIQPKKRGRRSKNAPVFEIPKVNNGEIITLKLGEKVRGVLLKKKKVEKSKKFFRNNLTVVMQTEGKLLNIKISKNGVFQATGAKNDDNVQMCISKLKDHIDNYMLANPNIKTPLSVLYNSDLTATFIPAMTNINFSLGFQINREALDEYINNNTEYYSLLETSFGYTGINIKLPLENDRIYSTKLRKVTFKNDSWVKEELTYGEYINNLTQKEQEKEKAKVRYNTILIFQSGNCILSGIHVDCMRSAYTEFFKIIEKCKHLIEEK